MMLTSKACSPGLFELSSTMVSYFVRGRCSCSKESKAPCKYKVNDSVTGSLRNTQPIRN